MENQVDELRQRQLPAATLHGELSKRSRWQTLRDLEQQRLRLLYLSPETLLSPVVWERLCHPALKINGLVLDEAHCLVQWGDTFRPAYQRLGAVRPALLAQRPGTQIAIAAFTATADPKAIECLKTTLQLRQPQVVQINPHRANLHLAVQPVWTPRDRYHRLLKGLNSRGDQAGLVYVRTRQDSEKLAASLKKQGFCCAAYLAGLAPAQRRQLEADWIADRLQFVVSTSAFGMGIDKADVRVVVHLDLPDSLEAYFQEAGRAGRDGEKAYAVLLYQEGDRENLYRNWELAFPSMEVLRRVYQALGAYFQVAVGAGEGAAFDFELVDFARTYQLPTLETFSALKVLQSEGWIVLTEAVFVPSSLKVLVTKEKLYDFLLRHRQFDRLLKTILRTYQGAFRDFVKISEKQLARFLKVPDAKLRRAFQQLHQEGIIRYRPQKDKPQLIFIRERVAAQNLTIDQERYRTLQARHRQRIDRAVAYAERNHCRQQQLLAYFGEVEAPLCGICDVCLGRNQSTATESEFADLRARLLALLATEARPLEDLMAQFTPAQRERVLRVVQYLLEEGILREREGKIGRG